MYNEMHRDDTHTPSRITVIWLANLLMQLEYPFGICTEMAQCTYRWHMHIDGTRTTSII